jgi:hypothetical protein
MYEIVKTTMKSLVWVDNVTYLMPELENAEPSTSGESTALKNVLEMKQIMFKESDSCNFNITADLTVAHHGRLSVDSKFR